MTNINRSIIFLQASINNRLAVFFDSGGGTSFSFPPIALDESTDSFSVFLKQHQVSMEEYVILLLSLAPHLQPAFLDSVIQPHLPAGGEFPEIGGIKGSNRSTLPTGETALFILAGMDINKRLETMKHFSPDHFFAKESILHLESVPAGEPRMSGRLTLQQEYVDLLTNGTVTRPSFGPDFPAKLVATEMDWNDLVLNPKTAEGLNDLKTWLRHNTYFREQWGMAKKIKPGYKTLFYGPPGTGKTLTASLLGKHFRKDVYRVDLSQVVSKYIGETEKNLEKIFAKAEKKDWILFFDEADALFGKRSGVKDAHDRYANQEVSYLLQRVEDFGGLIILASNYKANLDTAFIRRFNSIIHFPMPTPEEREGIWKRSMPPQASLAPDVDLGNMAYKYELSGSAILSAIHYASLQTIHKGASSISKEDLLTGIRKEYEKEERVFS